MDGVSKLFANPKEIHRTSVFSVKASAINVNCSSNQSSQANFTWHWSVYEIDPVTLEWRPTNSTFVTANLTSTSQTIIISSQKLHYGVKGVTVFFTRKDHYGASFVDFGFFSVVVSELTVSLDLVGGDVIYEENPRKLVFDGSKSYDPDYPGNNNGLKFVWFCLRSSEFLNISLDYNKIPITGPLVAHGNKNWGGCFGAGPGRLNSSLPTISLDSTLIDADNSYEIVLMVCKDKRMALATTSFTIVSKIQANYSIKCHTNCLSKVNPSTDLMLFTTCSGKHCDESKVLKWRLQRNDTSWHEIDFKKLPGTFTRNEYLNISHNALNESTEYQVLVDVKIESRNVSFTSSYKFITNSPPQGGNCSVNPTSGFADITLFIFNCTGWTDDQGATLDYRLYLPSRAWKINYGQMSSKSNGIKFSSGLAKLNKYLLTMNIEISDSWGAKTIYPVPFEVSIPAVS